MGNELGQHPWSLTCGGCLRAQSDLLGDGLCGSAN
jgi:hypothetical protein